MFNLILNEYSKIAWVYGPITCKLIPLRGLEEPVNAVQDNVVRSQAKTAIECICASPHQKLTICLKKYTNAATPWRAVSEEVQMGRLELVMAHGVNTLLNKKWDSLGSPSASSLHFGSGRALFL